MVNKRPLSRRRSLLNHQRFHSREETRDFAGCKIAYAETWERIVSSGTKGGRIPDPSGVGR